MKRTVIVLSMMVAVCDCYAQWECPSRLGATLKPIGDTDLMWSAEVTTSGGWIKDNYAANLMTIMGLNYGKGKNSFYVEGGLKVWTRGTGDKIGYSSDGFETVTYKTDSRSSILPGLREVFYKYSGERNSLILGLQSTRGDDSYLLNERMVGANYTLHAGDFKLNAVGGSVMEAFARNGRFCTYGYLYNDIVVGRPRSYVGNDFGDTNFGMVTLSYSPQKEADDFGTEKQRTVACDKIGAVAYTEFGRKINHRAVLSGLYSELTLAGVQLKPEVLFQTAKNNKAIVYNFTAEKIFRWSESQATKAYAQFVGYTAVDKDARAINSFSNLFMGDALRQDVLEAPLVMLGVKHSFTAIKTSLKVQGVMQTKASAMDGDYGFVSDSYSSPLTKMKELDFSVSKNFGKHLLVNAYYGMLDFPNLENTDVVLHYNHVQTMFGRLELRITF